MPATRYDAKLSAILRDAARVFARKGFDGASIRDVAAESGVSLSGLYYYFKGKDELLFLIQSHAFETLLEQIEAADPGPGTGSDGDAEARLRALVEGHLAFFAADVDAMKVLSHEADALPQPYAERVLELKRRYVALVQERLEPLLPEGAIDGRVATFALFGQMNWIYNWYRPERDPDPTSLARQLVHGFLHGVRTPLPAPSGT